MAEENPLKNYTDDELISMAWGGVGSYRTQAAHMELQKRLAGHLSTAIKSLKEKVFWLNVVLTAATTVGALATALMAYKAFYP